MLKMENARTKWRIKLQNAFNGNRKYVLHPRNVPPNMLSQSMFAAQKLADGSFSFSQ